MALEVTHPQNYSLFAEPDRDNLPIPDSLYESDMLLLLHDHPGLSFTTFISFFSFFFAPRYGITLPAQLATGATGDLRPTRIHQRPHLIRRPANTMSRFSTDGRFAAC